MSARSKIAVVAEDDDLLRGVAVEVLADAGFDVVAARHADEALEYLEVHFARVSLVFTDIHMPGSLNGLEMAHVVSRCWPNIVLFITSGEHLPTGDDLPAQSVFFRKPYELHHIVATANARLN